MDDLPLSKEGYAFMAAAFEVYNELGCGFTEEFYQEALEDELRERSIPFVAQPEIAVFYKRRLLRRKLRPDVLVFQDLVVELKAVKALAEEHEAQIFNYLKATGKPVGYLVNFGSHGRLEWKRFARTRSISENQRR